MEQVRNNLFQEKYIWLFMQVYAVIFFSIFRKESLKAKEVNSTIFLQE